MCLKNRLDSNKCPQHINACMGFFSEIYAINIRSLVECTIYRDVYIFQSVCIFDINERHAV